MIGVDINKLKELEMKYKMHSKEGGKWEDQNIEQYLIMIREKYLKQLRAVKAIKKYDKDIKEYVSVLENKFKIVGAASLLKYTDDGSKEAPKQEKAQGRKTKEKK